MNNKPYNEPEKPSDTRDNPIRDNPHAPGHTALIVVDVQNDFCEGGALAVDGGAAVAQRISDYLDAHRGRYHAVIASRDWHRPDSDNGGHFSAQPDFLDTWPAHCVAGTPGAQLHRGLAGHSFDAVVSKGMGAPAYSAFQATTGDPDTARTAAQAQHDDLHEYLQSKGITAVEVCGLALDYCVKATSLDAARLGYQSTVLHGLTAAVHPERDVATLAELRAAGVRLRQNPA